MRRALLGSVAAAMLLAGCGHGHPATAHPAPPTPAGFTRCDDGVTVYTEAGACIKQELHRQGFGLIPPLAAAGGHAQCIDISRWQPHPQFGTLRRQGIRCVIVQGADNAHASNPFFDSQIRSAHEAGMKVGVYIFAEGAPGAAQADALIAAARSERSRITLGAAVDAEVDSAYPHVCAIASELAHSFSIVYVYGSPGTYRGGHCTKYEWPASWGTRTPGTLPGYSPSAVIFWQWCGTCRLSGNAGEIDRDEDRGLIALSRPTPSKQDRLRAARHLRDVLLGDLHRHGCFHIHGKQAYRLCPRWGREWRDVEAAIRRLGDPRAHAATASTGAVANVPAGPPAPASGWKVAYADGFGASLGNAVGQDNTWGVENHNAGCCGNGNEIADERPSQVSVDGEGLKIKCEHVSTTEGKPYTCGGLGGFTSSPQPTGYRTPTVEMGKGQTIAFQWVGKLPQNYGTADPGVWMDGPPWTDVEFDFPEYWGYGAQCKASPGWTGCNYGFVWFGAPKPDLSGIGFPFDPTAANHTYTTEAFPTGTGKYRYSVWIDGHLQTLASSLEGWKGVTQSPEVSVDTAGKDVLRLTYALRQASGPTSTFQTNSWNVRSFAIYIDGNHCTAEGSACKTATGISNAGVAPGTTVSGSEPTEPPPPPPPPPPAPEAPATPAGCTASTHREGITSWLSASCTPAAGATGYVLWRTEATAKSSTAKPGEPWTSAATPAFTNHLGVKQGERYCFREAATNTVGQSPPSADFCVTA